MKPTPMIYTADELKDWSCEAEVEKGKWVYARPMGFIGLYLLRRIRLAWGVFTGKYDALKWIKQ